MSTRLRYAQRYNIHLDLAHTPFQNAVTTVASTPTSQFFNPSKLAFHDLTPNKIVPPIAKTVLGLGFKFVRTPPYTTNDTSAITSRFERDFQRKVFFATPDISDKQPDYNKLYVKSLWSPPLAEIPTWVDSRLSKFFTRLRDIFRRRKATPNLLPYQEATLRNL